MRTGNLFFSAVQFIFALLVLLVGGVIVGLQYAPLLRERLAVFFTSPSVNFSLFGAFVALFGVLLLVGFYWMHRGTYYTVAMGRDSIDIDPAVIQGYASDYLKTLFPDSDLSLEVLVKRRQKIELHVQLPPLEEQEAMLEQIEQGLSQVFEKHLGYFKKFSFCVLQR